MKLREAIFKTGSRARVLSAGVLVCLASATPFVHAAPPAGPKAVKIIFKQAFPGGSFDASPSNGTVNAPGSGQKAMRVFNTDGTLLAQGGSSATAWPKWLTDFEIGISGTNNEGAVNPACARFAATSEHTASKCSFNEDGSWDQNCGAMEKFFRISEYDCTNPAYTPAVTGKGGPQDGVYFRATFSRNPAYLARYENISAVIEYAASSLDPPSPDPTKCFPSGIFNPAQAGCSDQVWQTYLKHSAYELTQPFLMLIPPATAYRSAADGSGARTGGGIFTTRQFFLPLAGDSALTVFQISRIKSINNVGTNTEAFCRACSAACDGSTHTTAANSPHCLGVVVNSITFTRM